MASTLQPSRILSELSDLWVSLGAQHGDESAGVLRACAMTLVVLAERDEDVNKVGETLAALMRDHPSRAVVVRVRKSEEPELDARVYAQCWMPLGQRRQICCEQIEISASNGSLADVPAVVLPLQAVDLPVIVWARAARLLESEALRELARISTKTIIDSAQFPDPAAALAALRRARNAGWRLGDLAWTRLTRWRELIAQIFENPAYSSQLPSIRAVTIQYSDAVPTMSVRYLNAWLRECLEKAGSRPEVRRERAEGASDSGIRRIGFLSEDLNVSVEKVEGSATEVRVNALSNRTIFPEASDYVLMREELSIPGRDPVYEAALALAIESEAPK